MKRSKTLNLLRWPKKHCPDSSPSYFAAIVFGCLIVTYLELIFVGKGFYEFPMRPFPEVFSIDVFFILVFLPLFTFVFLYTGKYMSKKGRWLFFFMVSIAAAAFEMSAESAGLFRHTENWQHWYSVIGYFVFMHLVWHVSQWRRVNK